MKRLTAVTSVLLCLWALPGAAFEYFQALPERALVPADNPLTVEKADLGKMLFFDPRLSRDGSITCNDCHTLQTGANDGRALSTGIDGATTRRSAPTLLNIGLQTVYFWDGRYRSLEQLFVEHLAAGDIMGMNNTEMLINRLSELPDYVAAFKRAFPGNGPAISLQHTAQACASFLRTLLTPNSRYDQFVKGNRGKLNAQEKAGMELFRNIGCLSCHFGVNFAGPAPGPALQLGDGFYELFPNHPGSEYDQSMSLLDDLGVYEVSGNPADKRLWRVPPLRNIALTAPYFHNGSAPDLDTAIRVMAMAQYRKELSAEEVAAIRAFLLSLTGDQPAVILPQLPRAVGRPFYDFPTE